MNFRRLLLMWFIENFWVNFFDVIVFCVFTTLFCLYLPDFRWLKIEWRLQKKIFLYFSLQLNGWYLSNFLLTPRTQIFSNDFSFSISIMFENFILLRGSLYMKIMAILFFTLTKLHIRISTSICRWIRVRSSLIFQHNFSSLYLTYWFKHLVRLYSELAFIQLTRLCGD